MPKEKKQLKLRIKKNLNDSDGHNKITSVSSGKKTAMSHDSHLSSGKENKIDDHAESRLVYLENTACINPKSTVIMFVVNDFGADAQGKKDSLQAF